jgi:hypothetical protein
MGAFFMGVAQEKAQAFNGRKIDGQFQFDRDKTVYVNHYYFYIDDENFGPLFIKVCSYAPWRIKLCLKGHQWAKRQLNKRGIQYEALDNGSLSCSAPQKLQEVCDELGPEDVERVSGNGSVAFPCRSGRKTGARATTGIGRSGRWK